MRLELRLDRSRFKISCWNLCILNEPYRDFFRSIQRHNSLSVSISQFKTSSNFFQDSTQNALRSNNCNSDNKFWDLSHKPCSPPSPLEHEAYLLSPVPSEYHDLSPPDCSSYPSSCWADHRVLTCPPNYCSSVLGWRTSPRLDKLLLGRPFLSSTLLVICRPE